MKTTYRELDESILSFYSSTNLREQCEVLKKLIIDNSNLETPFLGNDIFLKVKKINEKILLGILHWYFPEEARFLINLWLEDNWGAEHLEVKDNILTSKALALGYLLVQDRWSDRDFFGNILTKNLIRSFKFVLASRKKSTPKEKVFRRGYNDKGSLTPSHLSKIYDYRKFRTVSEQFQIELLHEMKIKTLREKILERLRSEKIIS